MTAIAPATDRRFYAFNAVVSVVALGFLFWLLVLRTADAAGSVDLRFLPAVNASFKTCQWGMAARFPGTWTGNGSSPTRTWARWFPPT